MKENVRHEPSLISGDIDIDAIMKRGIALAWDREEAPPCNEKEVTSLIFEMELQQHKTNETAYTDALKHSDPLIVAAGAGLGLLSAGIKNFGIGSKPAAAAASIGFALGLLFAFLARRKVKRPGLPDAVTLFGSLTAKTPGAAKDWIARYLFVNRFLYREILESIANMNLRATWCIVVGAVAAAAAISLSAFGV